jgi:hypothetical protein
MAPYHSEGKALSAKASTTGRVKTSTRFYMLITGAMPLLAATVAIAVMCTRTNPLRVSNLISISAIVLISLSIWYTIVHRRNTNIEPLDALKPRNPAQAFGVGSSLVGLAAYTLLEVGLYGALGPSAASLAAEHFDLHVSWSVWATGAWAIVSALSSSRIKQATRSLLDLGISIQVAVIVTLLVSSLRYTNAEPIARRVAHLNGTNLGIILSIAVLGYIALDYSPEASVKLSERSRKTPQVMYLPLVGIALVYTESSLFMAEVSQGRLAVGLENQNPATKLDLDSLILYNIGQLLYLAALFSAIMIYNAAGQRCILRVDQKDKELSAPPSNGEQGKPKISLVLRALICPAAIFTIASLHIDPMLELFRVGGGVGALGIMVLLTLMAVSTARNFVHTVNGKPIWKRFTASAIFYGMIPLTIEFFIHYCATLFNV